MPKLNRKEQEQVLITIAQSDFEAIKRNATCVSTREYYMGRLSGHSTCATICEFKSARRIINSLQDQAIALER